MNLSRRLCECVKSIVAIVGNPALETVEDMMNALSNNILLAKAIAR